MMDTATANGKQVIQLILDGKCSLEITEELTGLRFQAWTNANIKTYFSMPSVDGMLAVGNHIGVCEQIYCVRQAIANARAIKNMYEHDAAYKLLIESKTK
jgi:hypothetical protein